MPELLSDTSFEQLARAIEPHYAEWYRLQGSAPGMELHADPDITWLLGPLPSWSNGGVDLRFRLDTAERRLGEILGRYSDAGFGAGFWVGPNAQPADQLPGLLRRLGLRCRKYFPGMACLLRSMYEPLDAPAGVEIRLVEDHGIFRQQAHPYIGRISTAIRRFELERHEYLCGMRPQRVFEFVALRDGRPVGSSLLYLGQEIASLHDIGVLETERRRGIGAALTAHACRVAREQGYHAAILIASAMGDSVYERIGFREVCRIGYWYRGKSQA